MPEFGVTLGVEPVSLDELKSIIQREQAVSLGVEGGKLSSQRRIALEYYEGEPFGDEVEGRSQVVMLSVLEAVEWVLPALLRIFCASDKLATFEPRQAQFEKEADLKTAYFNYIFYKDNPGFMILHDWFKDALTQKLGWIKVYWDTQKYTSFDTYTGLTVEEADALADGEGVETVERDEYDAPEPDFSQDLPNLSALGQPGAKLVDLKLKTTRKEGRIKIMGAPPEEVLVSPRAKVIDTELPYSCHRRAWLYTDLVEQGYDEDTLKEAIFDDSQQYNTERVARFQKEEDWPFTSERTDKAALEVWTEENYIRVDWDGDGIAELNKVVTAGNARVILTKNGVPDIEPLDEVPLIPITPIPMPHKLVGMSLADLTMDLQKIKSVLMRQMLDNLYLTNNPRHYVNELMVGDNTYDDLLTSRPGGLVRGRGENAVVPLETPFVANAAMPMIEYVDQIQETRTGVARHNQEIDANIINKSSSGVQTHLMQQAAAQRVELIARIFAEGVKKLAEKVIRIVAKYQQQERVVRITGQFVPIDPRHWRDNVDATVNVGLGSGNRDQQQNYLQQLLADMEQIGLAQKGMQGPILYWKNVYDVMQRLTESAGFKESFFVDPTQPPPPGIAGPPQPQQPDPDMIKAQTQMAQAKQQAQLDQEKQQFDMAMQQQKAQLDAQNDEREMNARLTEMRMKGELEMQLAQQRAQLELKIANDKANHDMMIERTREAAKIAGGMYEKTEPGEASEGQNA